MKSTPIHRIAVFCTLLLTLLLTSCKDDDTSDERIEQEQRYFDLYMGSTFQDTIADPIASGLYFIEVKEGSGDTPGAEDWVYINFAEILIPSEEVVDTYMEEVAVSNGIYSESALYGPLKLLNGSKPDGITEGLTLMKEGGQAIFCMTSDLAYGSRGVTLQREVGPYNSIRFEVELLEVIGPDIEAYEAQRIIDYTDTIPGADTVYSESYESTMYYVIDETTAGSPVGIDSTVKIAYKGYLMDGRVFDESGEDETYDFTVGDYDASTSPIPGWHLGVLQFREGEKGRIIIPYPLAYGEGGRISNNIIAIPPYETLVFEIEVVDVSSDGSSGTDPV